MESKPNKIQTVIILSLFLVTCGCFSTDKYTYESIRKEYSKVIYDDVVPTKVSKTEQYTCALLNPISLNDAIQIALANNPDNKMAIARIKQAEAMIEKANANFSPTLGFYTEYSQGNAPSGYLFNKIDQRLLPANIDFNYPGWYENYETGIKAGINIFNGGRDILNKKIAETDFSISRIDRQSVENSLVASVIHTYYNALAAKQYIIIAKESVSTVKSQLRLMNVRFRAGGALKSDILSLEVRLAQAKEDMVLSENRLKTTLTAFASILGVSPEVEIRLKETESSEIPLPDEYIAGAAYALENRPEVNKIKERVKQARMALDLSRAEYLPRVDLRSKYYVDDPEMSYSDSRDNWTAAVIFNWDMFTGFSTKAEEKKVQTIIEEMLAADLKTKLSVKLDVKNAYLKVAEAKARIEVAEKSVAMAEESFNLVKKQYEGGSATITRYLEAELALNRAKTRTTAAYYDREKAFADIGRAVGYWGKTYNKTQDKNIP
ncbi:MAG: TolC family protein [Desulfobacterales bacterium]|nr:TolC family protein [Desulfobacterales bacterium]